MRALRSIARSQAREQPIGAEYAQPELQRHDYGLGRMSTEVTAPARTKMRVEPSRFLVAANSAVNVWIPGGTFTKAPLPTSPVVVLVVSWPLLVTKSRWSGSVALVEKAMPASGFWLQSRAVKKTIPWPTLS